MMMVIFTQSRIMGQLLGTRIVSSSSLHQLSLYWMLISVLIVSSSPSRSSSLSDSGPSSSPLPSSSSILFSSNTSTLPPSSSSSLSPLDSSHVGNLSWQQKISSLSSSKSTASSSSPLIFNSSPSNQFPSVFSSFNFGKTKQRHRVMLEGSKQKKPISLRGADGEVISRNGSHISTNNSFKQTNARMKQVDKSVMLFTHSGRRAMGDNDKSDNQISEHHRHAPFHWGDDAAAANMKEQNSIIRHHEVDNVTKVTKTVSGGVSSESGSDSAGAITFPLVNLPKRQVHEMKASSSQPTASSSSSIISVKGKPSHKKQLGLLYEEPKPAIGSDGESIFTVTDRKTRTTVYPDHIVSDSGMRTFTSPPIQDPVPPQEQSQQLAVSSAQVQLQTRHGALRTRRRVKPRGKVKGEDKTLTILGLFELTQNSLPRESGRSERIAAEMALEDINAKGILQGYRLTMHTNDTQCDPGSGVDAFFHALQVKKDSKIVSLLGTACSEVTERLAKVATHQRIIQVSFGSTSPSLSDKKEFPLFYRTVAPVSSHSEAIIELIRHFQWDTVTFFTKNENRYTMPANFLVSELEKTNVTCKATLTFSISDYQDQLQEMKELDSRIIIANFGSDVAPLVFCEIYRMGMYGSDYAWILIGEPETDWWLEPPASSSSPSFSPSPSGGSRGRFSRAAKTKKGHRKRAKRNSKLSSSPSSARAAALSFKSSRVLPSSTSSPITSSDDGSGFYSSGSYYFSQATTQPPPSPSSSAEKKSHQFRRSVLGLEEPMPYDEDETSSTDDNADSISIRMGTSKASPANRVAISSKSSTSRDSPGFHSDPGSKSSDKSNDHHHPSSTGRRLNSSSNPGTLRLRSGGKSLHQKEQHRHPHHHQSDCSSRQLMEVVQYAIVVDRYNILEQPTDSGMTTATFQDRLLKRSNAAYNTSTDIVGSQFAPETYDAVWAVALGLERVQTKHNYNFDEFNRTNGTFTRLLKSEIGQLNFSGISGPITFSGSDRIGITSFMQIQDGEMVQVGLFYPDRPTNKLELSCKGCRKIRWKGNQVPISRREFRFKRIRVEYSLYIIVATAASLGIVLAATFLAFNLYHRKLKYIKLSSPKLNNIVIIGCMFAYLAVILLGTDFTTVPDGNQFAYICIIRAYLLSMAFSLAFGAMFAKTYRVYRIFTRSCIGVVKNKLLRDTQLMTLVMVLVLIDCIVVSSWALFDPMHVNLRNLTLQIDPSDRTVVYQPQIEVCRSQHAHVWLSALYGYKSLLLVVGLYMAWETRHVKIQALNDSKYIGLCVYIVVLTSVLAVSLVNLISERVTVSFVSVTSLILFATTVTLCLLFLPKIHAITNKNTNTSDPIVESMGLKIECNTRRFIVEDTKELLFRAEVQNRVYKRQINAIDAEIWRLENLLTYSPSKGQQSVGGCGEAPGGGIHSGTDGAIKGANKKGKRKSGAEAGTSGMGGEDDEEETSSDEDDSTSEIYTVYLHGPRFIVPISLFNFRNSNATIPRTLPSIGISGDSPEQQSGSPTTHSSAPRSSWPNSRYLGLPTNGLIAKNYRFKSEPRLQGETSSPSGGGRGEPESSQKGLSIISRARASWGNIRAAAATTIPPPTIIQWGDDDDVGYNNMELEGEMVGISGVSSAGSSTTSCNNIALGKMLPSSRKGSSTSGTASKRSSIFSAFKNPWSYLTGFIKQPGNSGSSSNSRKDSMVNYYYNYPMELGDLGTGTSDGGQQDNYLLKPIAYFGGQSKSSASSSTSHQQRQKFSSVPDLWAVRGSPDLDANHYSHKKYSVNSDTAAVGGNGINPASSSTELGVDNPDPDPVLKLIVTSHESVYL